MHIDGLISACNRLFKIANNRVDGIRDVHQNMQLQGAYKWTVWVRHGAVQFGDRRESPWIRNIIVNGGVDEILQMLGNLAMHSYFNKIGVGDGTATPMKTDTDLVGANTFYKTVAAVDTVYVRPNLILTIQLAYTDAVFTWNEFVLKNSNDVTCSRTVDTVSPLPKTNSMLAMLQYQVSIS